MHLQFYQAYDNIMVSFFSLTKVTGSIGTRMYTRVLGLALACIKIRHKYVHF